MISNQETTIKNKLLNIIDDLNKYHTPNKADLLKVRIQERLDKCLKQYYKELSNNFDKLYSQSDGKEFKLIKKLSED